MLIRGRIRGRAWHRQDWPKRWVGIVMTWRDHGRVPAMQRGTRRRGAGDGGIDSGRWAAGQ